MDIYVDTVVKKPAANMGDTGGVALIQVGKNPWSRKQQSTPVFLPGKFHGRTGMLWSMGSHSRNH